MYSLRVTLMSVTFKQDMDVYYKKLPAKRMGTGALIWNGKGQLLILKTSYKDYWSIPGGVVEENESPREACIREVKEETSLDLNQVKFLCVDYTRADTSKNKNESLQFVFYGGKLTKAEMTKIKIDGKEIVAYDFVSLEKATELLGGFTRGLVRRLPACLEAIRQNKGVYLEEGVIL